MIVSILPSHHGKHDHAQQLDHFMGTPSPGLRPPLRKTRRQDFDRRELSAAKSWKRDTEQAIERELLRAGECPTFREAVGEFMAGARDGSIRCRGGERYRPSTLRGYEFALKTLLPRIGSLR
jgi:hypothetical protein